MLQDRSITARIQVWDIECHSRKRELNMTFRRFPSFGIVRLSCKLLMHKMLQITKDFGNTSASKKPGLVKSFPILVGKTDVRKSIGKARAVWMHCHSRQWRVNLCPIAGTPEAWRSK